MHREISHGDQSEPETNLSLYLLTGIVGLLLLADLWPYLAGWLNGWNLGLPTWPNTLYGYRIALIAAIFGGARALYGSIDSLLQGRFGADLALAIACIAAILLQEPLVAAEIVFIGMFGECLEAWTFGRTQNAIRKLAEVFPRRCWRLREGQEERVQVHELQPGDLVVVKPGGRIPCDGKVTDGRSSLDTSALTGESLPIERGPGDEVLAGSLNQTGALTITAERVAEHTVAGQVVEWTARALKDKAPLERTADRLARWFLPAVLGLALGTFLVALLATWGGWGRALDAPRLSLWQAVRIAAYPALSVLVVACPCALILATPAAVIAALGRLAGTGVLIKSGAALERLATVDAFAFDKTGTLTEGRLELARIVSLAEGFPEETLLAWAASAEQRSEHLLAELVVREARQRGLTLLPVERFVAYPGRGILAALPEGTLLIGNRRLLEELGVELPEAVTRLLEELDAAGQTALLVARGSLMEWATSSQIQTQPGAAPTSEPTPGVPDDLRVIGVLGVRDRVRAEAGDVVTALRGLGVGHVAMLTGDRAAVARTVADRLGLAEVHAELLPTQKAEFVQGWEAEGKRVAMVGDGINDAPALARATVGIAIGGGTDIAAETGDVVCMGDPLRHLPLLLRLSRQTVEIIRQNILWFAVIVNLVGVVLTSWLWPLFVPVSWYEQSPLAAVLYHQLGSLAVLLNSMRLLWFERPESPAYAHFRGWVSGVNDWSEKHLNLEESLHWLTHRWRTLLAGLAMLVLVSYPLWGLTQIESDEVGVVQRFGKPVRDLSPGLHWCWPWPVETVRRVQPERIRTVAVGYRSEVADARSAAGRAWSSGHSGEGIRRIPEEAVMITGDGDLIEVQASFRYRITDPHVYLFDVSDPEVHVRGCAEAVFRELIASRSFENLLTLDRSAFAREALARLQKRLANLPEPGLGLAVESLALHDLHPPLEVVGAYHRVAVAMERADRRVNEAEASRTLNLADQQGRSLQTVSEASVQSYEKERLAAARRTSFAARDESRSTLPWVTEAGLLLTAGGRVEIGQKPEVVLAEYRAERQRRLAVQAYLTEFRIASEGVASALALREKVLIDDLALPAWLQLWMILGEQRRGLLPGGDSFDFSGRRPTAPPMGPGGRRPEEP